MLSFKQFITEMAKSTIGSGFQPTTKMTDIEPKVIYYLENPNAKPQSNDEKRTKTIASAIPKHISNKVKYPIKIVEATHTPTPKVAIEKRTDKTKKTKGGRPVEDGVLEVMVGNRRIKYRLDMKLSPRASGATLSADTLNGIITGKNRDEREGISKDEDKSHTLYPPIAKRTTIESKDKYINIIRMVNVFNDGGQKYINMRIKDGVIINNSDVAPLERRKRAVWEIMNHHEEIPDNVRRLQINNNQDEVTVHDPDETWAFFHKHINPYDYVMEHIGNTAKIYALNEKGEKIMHIGSINVKENNKKKKRYALEYNVKHYLHTNLMKHKDFGDLYRRTVVSFQPH